MLSKQVGASIKMVLATLIVISLLVGCSSKTSTKPTNSPKTGGSISVGVNGEPDTLDMHLTSMSIANQIGSHLGGSLLALNPDSLKPEPYLAESYEVSDNGKTITFKIRDHVTFHDGTPLTAEIYKRTFERILNPESGATVSKSLLAGVKSIEATDDKTLVIHLEVPSAPIFMSLALEGYMQPFSPKALEKLGINYGRNPVGVGPWKFKEWQTGQSITLEKNNDYKWAQGFYDNQKHAYPNQLVYKFIKDNQTLLAALDSGAIDIAMNVAAKDVKRYKHNKKFQVLDYERQGLGLFMEMNSEHPLLGDVHVRKALNLAINKDAIIKAALSGEGTPAFGPLSPTIFGYDEKVKEYGYHYSKEEAIGILEQAGWKKNEKGVFEKDGNELKFSLSISDGSSQQAQMVQAMLKEIGIEINIQSMESGTLIEKVSKGEYELGFLSYSYGDPDALYILFHSSQIGGLNHTRVNNPELDALLDKGRTTVEMDKRKEIYGQIQKMVVEEAYIVPIYSEKIFTIVNSSVRNVEFTPAGLMLHDSWVEKP